MRLKCEAYYNTDLANSYSVGCTIAILFFTVFLELGAHYHANCCHTISDDEYPMKPRKFPKKASRRPTIVNEQPRRQTTPDMNGSQTNASSTELEAQPAPKKQPPQEDCCVGCRARPSPNIRANRLIVAIFFYAIVLTAFILRFRDIEHPHIRPECTPYVWRGDGSIPGPNWWAVGLLNIVPFIFATFSMLRTVVDCVLVRWGLHLKYAGEDGPNDWLTWPQCMPVFLVFVCIRAGFRWPIALLMGRPRESGRPRHDMRAGLEGDIEMQGEETRRLVDDHDDDAESDYEGDGSGPPAYDYAVHDRGSARTVAGKGGSG